MFSPVGLSHQQAGQCLPRRGWPTWGVAGPDPGPGLLSWGTRPGKPSGLSGQQVATTTSRDPGRRSGWSMVALGRRGVGAGILEQWEEWLMAKQTTRLPGQAVCTFCTGQAAARASGGGH